MKLARRWLFVEVNTLYLGLLGSRGRSQVTILTAKHNPVWLQKFAGLCRGDWRWADFLTSQEVVRFEKLAKLINRRYKTNFQIKSRWPKGLRGPQIVLVGG